MIKAFIFDMDGTLFDTESVTKESLRAISRKHGEREDIDEFYPTTCGATIEKAKLLYDAFYGTDYPFYGTDYPFYERREEMRQWIRDFIDTNGVPVKKGAKELLTYLKDNGYKIALATSATRASAEGHIKKAGFEHFFDATVCGDEIKNSKPHPEIFLTAAQKLGIAPENCAVAEDSYLGVESGTAAGMQVFMVPDMNPPRDKEKTLAFKICNDLLEVMDYLK